MRQSTTSTRSLASAACSARPHLGWRRKASATSGNDAGGRHDRGENDMTPRGTRWRGLAAAIAMGAVSSLALAFVRYDVAGSATIVPGITFCSDVLGCPLSAAGTATCTLCPSGAPPSGTFTLLGM